MLATVKIKIRITYNYFFTYQAVLIYLLKISSTIFLQLEFVDIKLIISDAKLLY